MKNFDQFARAIADARSHRALSKLDLQVVQTRTLLPLEIFSLGRLSGIRLCSLNRRAKKETQS